MGLGARHEPGAASTWAAAESCRLEPDRQLGVVGDQQRLAHQRIEQIQDIEVVGVI